MPTRRNSRTYSYVRRAIALFSRHLQPFWGNLATAPAFYHFTILYRLATTRPHFYQSTNVATRRIYRFSFYNFRGDVAISALPLPHFTEMDAEDS